MISSPGWVCLTKGAVGPEVDAGLDDLVAGDAEIVLLEIGALDSFWLLGGHDASSF